MPLRDWVYGRVATATPATIATVSSPSRRSVAEVATVAVANPEKRKYTSPESKWPEFSASLARGALVVCLRCSHYSGPDLDALGHCAALNCDAAPDAPFWCPSFSRRAT